MNGEYLNNLRTADDIALISESTDRKEEMILQLHKNFAITQRKSESRSEDENEENKGGVQQIHIRPRN